MHELPFIDGTVGFGHDVGQLDVGIPFQIAHQQPDLGLHVAFPEVKGSKEHAAVRSRPTLVHVYNV